MRQEWGKWEFVEDREVRLWPDNVIRCRFHEMHRLHPGGFYEVRWCRRDRGKFVEITRETFQLKNHVFGALAQSESRAV